MEYLDFEVAVEPKPEGGYAVSVVDSPAGEARAEMRFPYDRLALNNRMQALQIALLRSGGKRRSVATDDDRAVEELGRDLFQAIFSGDVASRLSVSRIIASREGRGVRIKLRISAPELMALPWEYLYDVERGDYLALGVGTPVVRYVPLPQSIRPLEVTPPIRVLGMIAGPRDLGELDATRERQRLELALGRLQERKLVEFEWVPGETWADLQEALWRGPWHVFHFIGHGGFNRTHGTGLIYLSGDDGNSREMSATDIGRLLGDHEPLRLAVLNSCDTAQGSETDVFSSTAATLVRRGTPAVVAMQFQITDDAAIQFSRVFYAAIAYGMPVDAAVAEARKSVALQIANTYEWGTPVLFMRSRDGLLFRMPEAGRVKAGTEPDLRVPTEQPLVPIDEPPAARVEPAVSVEPPVATIAPSLPTEPAAVPTAEPPGVPTAEPPALPPAEPPTVPPAEPPGVRTAEPPPVPTAEPPTVPPAEPPPVPPPSRSVPAQPAAIVQPPTPGAAESPTASASIASLLANDYLVAASGAAAGVLAGVVAGAIAFSLVENVSTFYSLEPVFAFVGGWIGGSIGVYSGLRLRSMPDAWSTALMAAVMVPIAVVIAIIAFARSFEGAAIAGLVAGAIGGVLARAIVRRRTTVSR